MNTRTPGMAAYQRWQELCVGYPHRPNWSALRVDEKAEWEEVARAAIEQAVHNVGAQVELESGMAPNETKVLKLLGW